MYKKRRITDFKRRILKQKRVLQRRLARQLVSGELNLSQVQRLAGAQLHGVFKTLAYLEKTEGVAIPAALATVVVQAVSPAFSGIEGAVGAARSRTRSVNRTPTTTRRRDIQETDSIETTEDKVETAEPSPATPAPARRARATQKAQEEPVVVSEKPTAPAPPRRTRATRKTQEEPVAASEKPTAPAPARRTRAVKEAQAAGDNQAGKTTPTRKPRAAENPEANETSPRRRRASQKSVDN